MDALDTSARVTVEDDLFNFALGEEDDDDEKATTTFGPSAAATKAPSSSSLESLKSFSQDPDGDDQSGPFLEFVEEELEWLSNKDAFPSLETCLDILSDQLEFGQNYQSPVSVLESIATTSSDAVTNCCNSLQVPVHFPVRCRSKGRRRRVKGCFPDLTGRLYRLPSQANVKNPKPVSGFPRRNPGSAKIGRSCQHCGSEKTPQWRAGPDGPKTLCNACGVRYKSGRLVPEYRPASSPTFCSKLHSNSHRKIMEMKKKQQQQGKAGIVGDETCFGYRVG